MKPTPFLEQIIHLITLFLDSRGQTDLSSTLKQTYELPEWIQHQNPLFKKGLVKIIKEYVKSNQKITKYYTNRSPPEQVEEEEEEEEEEERKSKSRKHSVDSLGKATSPKIQTRNSPHHTKGKSPKINAKAVSPKQVASSWISKFEQPKRLEQITGVTKPVQIAEIIHPQVKVKTHSKKQKKILSSDFEQQDSFELEPRKKHKKQAKQQKKHSKEEEKKEKKEHQKHKKQKIAASDIEEDKPEEKIVIEQEKPAVEATPKNYYYGSSQATNGNNPRKFFSRINLQEVGDIRHELKDNSFQAKAKYGQAADEWGQFGYDKLKDARGESFKKTKGKLKNRAFQGAMMDINKINSIPID